MRYKYMMYNRNNGDYCNSSVDRCKKYLAFTRVFPLPKILNTANSVFKYEIENTRGVKHSVNTEYNNRYDSNYYLYI